MYNSIKLLMKTFMVQYLLIFLFIPNWSNNLSQPYRKDGGFCGHVSIVREVSAYNLDINCDVGGCP